MALDALHEDRTGVIKDGPPEQMISAPRAKRTNNTMGRSVFDGRAEPEDICAGGGSAAHHRQRLS